MSKKLLKNIYYAAKYHKDENNLMMNDLLRDDVERAKCRGAFDAYAFIVLMIENEGVGNADYKKVFKMEDTFPNI